MPKKKDNVEFDTEVSEIHNTENVTVQVLDREYPKQELNSNDLAFEVSYPKDFNGIKKIPEGIIIVSKETADILINKGIGKIVN